MGLCTWSSWSRMIFLLLHALYKENRTKTHLFIKRMFPLPFIVSRIWTITVFVFIFDSILSISQLVRALYSRFPLRFMAQAQSMNSVRILQYLSRIRVRRSLNSYRCLPKVFQNTRWKRRKTRHFEGAISSSFSPLNHWRRGSNLEMYSVPPFFNAYFQKLWHSLDYLRCTASSNFRTKGHPHSSRSRAPLFPLSLPLQKPVTQVTYSYRWMPNIS